MKDNLLFVFGHILGGLGYNKNQRAFYVEKLNDKSEQKACLIKLSPSKKDTPPYPCGEITTEDCIRLRDYLDKHIKETNGD